MLARKISLPVRHLVLTVVTALLVLASPALAFAANGPWQSVDLTLVSGQNGQPVLLVAGQLPTSTSLPAKVTLAVPAGTEIAWAGEILGGETSKDPSVQYSVKTGKDYDLVEFTLTKSRIGQVEVAVPSAISSNGGATQAAIDWVAPFGIPSSNLLVQLPSGAKVTSGTAEATTTANGTASWYKRTVRGVSKGDRLKLAVAYTAATTSGGAETSSTQPQSTGAAGTTPRSGASPLLIVSVLGLLIALTIALMKRVSPADTTSDEADDEESDEADDAEPDAADDAEPARDCEPGCTCGSRDAASPVKKQTLSTKSGTGAGRSSAAKKRTE